MLLPLRSKNPPESVPFGTIGLIALNIIVFCFTVDGVLGIRKEVLDDFALSYNHITPVTLFSHMFLHTNVLHLLGNMWFLYLFGFAVEGRLRTAKFLLVYFLSGLCGATFHIVFFGRGDPNLPMLGASGAIMGVLGAALYLFPYGQVDFLFSWRVAFWRVSTWSIMWVAAFYVGFDLLFQLLASGTDRIAHLAHVGGALGGFIVCAILRPKRDSYQASNAKATFHDTKDLAMLSSPELAAMAVNNPNDTTLILNWMHRNIRDGNIRTECYQAFIRLLPLIMEREPAPPVAFALMAMSSVNSYIRNEHLMYVAHKVEACGEVTLAMRLYDAVVRNPASTTIDMEAALFRSALICETKLRNRQQAVATYRQIIERFPMSPMAEQARMRLREMPI
jgi:membrane associated rhomboid family serine protease